jgi:hypothetical protein
MTNETTSLVVNNLLVFCFFFGSFVGFSFVVDFSSRTRRVRRTHGASSLDIRHSTSTDGRRATTTLEQVHHDTDEQCHNGNSSSSTCVKWLVDNAFHSLTSRRTMTRSRLITSDVSTTTSLVRTDRRVATCTRHDVFFFHWTRIEYSE